MCHASLAPVADCRTKHKFLWREWEKQAITKPTARKQCASVRTYVIYADIYVILPCYYYVIISEVKLFTELKFHHLGATVSSKERCSRKS